MKKIVKRLVSLTCVAALAATCCVGASAKDYNSTVGNFPWSASITLINPNTYFGYFTVSTSGGWSSVYNSTVGVKANYNHASGPNQTDGWVYAEGNKTSITYDCIHSPSVSNQNSQHYVAINGASNSVSLYL